MALSPVPQYRTGTETSAVYNPLTEIRSELELQLLHAYLTTTAPCMASDDESRSLFADTVPSLAFESDALLWTMYSLTALHQSRAPIVVAGCVDSPAIAQEQHYQFYLHAATNQCRLELKPLPSCVCLIITHFMCLMPLAKLSGRCMQPYKPPIEWMTEARNLEWLTKRYLADDDQFVEITELLYKTGIAWPKALRPGLNSAEKMQHLLPQVGNGEGHDGADSAIYRAYESALGLISSAFESLQRRTEAPDTICRRLVMFPLLVDEQFVVLVDEARPRALVIMAHYFALLIMVEGHWYIGNTARWEVRAIGEHLSSDGLDSNWSALLEFPLKMSTGLSLG